MDGYLMSVPAENGTPPNSIDMQVPSPIPDFLSEDGPLTPMGPHPVVTYRRTHTHPSHGLLPVYRPAKQ